MNEREKSDEKRERDSRFFRFLLLAPYLQKEKDVVQIST